MENVGPFREPYKVDFDSSLSSCSAIVGLNGTGKSTLFRCIGLCLFGSADRANYPSQEQYEEKIRSLVRPVNQRAGALASGGVTLWMHAERDGQNHEIRISRKWALLQDALSEELRVLLDEEGVPLAGKELEAWLSNWAPPERAGVVLFDAESAYSASEQQLNELLASAFRQAVGLDLFDSLLGDLDRLMATITRKDKSARKRRATIEALDTVVERLSRDLEAQATVEAELKRHRSALASRSVEIRFLVGAGDGDESEYAHASRRLTKLDAARAGMRAELETLCSGLAPTILCRSLARGLHERLRAEERALSAFEAASGRRMAVAEALEELEQLESWPGIRASQLQRAQFLEFLEGVLMAEIEAPAEPPILHDLTRSDRGLLERWFAELDSGASVAAAEVLRSRLLDAEFERAEVARRLSVALEPAEADRLLEELSDVDAQLAKLDEELISLAERRGYLSHELALKTQKKDAELRSAVASLGSAQNADLLLRTRDASSQLAKRIARLKAAQVGEAAQAYLACWLRKEDLVGAVEIHPDSLAVVLRNGADDVVTLGHLSAGERQVVILAILLAMRDVAQVEQPLLVDTPLARLDAVHARRVSSAVASSNGQAVLFMTDEEWQTLNRVAPDHGVPSVRLPDRSVNENTQRVS